MSSEKAKINRLTVRLIKNILLCMMSYFHEPYSHKNKKKSWTRLVYVAKPDLKNATNFDT